MSVRDKIVLLSALIIIVGGALIINGRFNAATADVSSQSENASESSVSFPRQLAIKDIDTLNDARGAVKIIKDRALEVVEVAKPKQVANRTISKEASSAIRATVEVTPKHKSVKTVSGSTYTVKKGQTLTDIAIVVYNEKTNAIKNARKIYELNKDVLTSMDKIKVGQKLRVPSLNKQDTSKLKQLAEAMPDKIQFMSSKYSSAPKGKLYVVKKGDSLWNIAQANLGSGKRYNEIIKANKSLLGKSNKLSPGMAILIPN